MKLLISLCFSFCILVPQEKWTYSAEGMDQIKIDGKSVRRLTGFVRFVKSDKTLLTDNAIQDIQEDVLHLNGNTLMIDGPDTLKCDSMVYYSKLDSGFAMGNVFFIQKENNRRLTTPVFHYWQTEGFRGSSFIAEGYSRVEEEDQLILANRIQYDDDSQTMLLKENASVEDPSRGIFGDEIILTYADSLLEKIEVLNNAFAYNDLKVRVTETGPYQKQRDEMSGKEMVIYFKNDEISRFDLTSMASTKYNVIEDSLLVGENEANGDTITVQFKQGEMNRIQVMGGALGEFRPEGSNTRIDTTIFYGGNYIDYHIDKELTYLADNAFVEYEDTRLSAGNIRVDWETNILDAARVEDNYPTVQTIGEEPMSGNSMVFDLIAKHGRIDKGRTAFNQSYYHGTEVFRDDPNVFHVDRSKYTSCDLDNPHFYLGSRKMKMLPGDRVIAKPLWLHVYDIPIFGFPLAVFPNKGGRRHSGWIMPSFDYYDGIGTGFRNFGYYWAPNDHMDEKLLLNFFDKEGIHVNSRFKYKKRHGDRWYNFQFNGYINGTWKHRITTSEIMDLFDNDLVKEEQRLNWTHNQQFDPTQRLAIEYEYVSNKDAYQNDSEVNLQNRLKQNLSSSFNYSKNWQTSSISLGYNQFRDLSIENKSPESVGYLIENRYKSYKYENGPLLNFRLGNRKIFGVGDRWYNSLNLSYSLKASTGRRDHWLIKEDDATWAGFDTTKVSYGGIKHSARLNAPQTFFNWLTVNPNLSLREDWILNYKQLDENGEEAEVEGFKRRLTWNSSLSTKTKIYGLFPIPVGRLTAIRHSLTPSLTYHYQPDFSDSRFGGDSYFQNNKSEEDRFDYFKNSYVGATSQTEKKTYSFSVDNVFQAKVRKRDGGYNKINFLTWNSSFSYNTLKDSLKLSELTSNIRVKNFGGSELFRIRMYHNFYQLGENKEPINTLMDIGSGELPRLTRMDVSTDMKFTLSGTPLGSIEKLSDEPDTTVDIEDEFYSYERKTKSDKDGKNWDTKLQFKYNANWRHTDEEWDYKFSLKTVNSIKLSKNWSLSYIADFNIKERSLTYHSFRIYRPLHCWEFSFNYWPRGNSSGFSLRINVKNPDLQDIKITSKDGRRGFGGF